MLFLLRKIRRKLLTDNKVTTYMLYAVGEIILVVVGILIAVSIDDLNEKHTNNKRVENALGFLVDDLKEDSITINKLLLYYTPRRDKSKNLFDRASSRNATIDTLVQIMSSEFDGYWDKHFAYKKAAYENIKNGGILELLADSLRLQITDTYHAYERNVIAMQEQNKQYRDPATDFYMRFPIFQFYPHDDFIANWRTEYEKEFHPRAEWLLFVHYYMWNGYIKYLEEEQIKVNTLLSTLQAT